MARFVRVLLAGMTLVMAAALGCGSGSPGYLPVDSPIVEFEEPDREELIEDEEDDEEGNWGLPSPDGTDGQNGTDDSKPDEGDNNPQNDGSNSIDDSLMQTSTTRAPYYTETHWLWIKRGVFGATPTAEPVGSPAGQGALPKMITRARSGRAAHDHVGAFPT
ncbi:MAG: hypothetical protein MJE77_33370 [Proteobacteria bacterium]|nr:hypothetical protein [Pseudomonadota bacterium]